MNTFPMIVNLEGKMVYLCGAGKMALHKIRKLQAFGCFIKVFAEDETLDIEETEKISVYQRKLSEEDLKNPPLFIVSALADKLKNRKLHNLSSRYKIPFNAVDDPLNCDFIFPSIIKKGKLLISVSSEGVSPTGTIAIKDKIERMLPDKTDEIILYMPRIKSLLKVELKDSNLVKMALMEIFNYSMIQDRCISNEEINQIIKKYK